jgi:alcohol dehydrogenase class IV
MPATFQVNYEALRGREPNHPSLGRMSEVAYLLTGGRTASPEAAVEWLVDLTEALVVPGLAHYGVTESQIPILVDAGQKASSMRGNPIILTDEELASILTRSL